MARLSNLSDTESVRALLFGFALFAYGCGGNLAPLPSADLSAPATASVDMLPSDEDAGPTLLPIGQPCTVDAQCQTNVCFVGGMRSFCTLRCTLATQAQDCPVPVTSGECNMQGFCKPPS
jgi:hypothetical protein